MKIAVIGGGPAGLYFARLIKRLDPGHEVEVIEQNPPDATYGFGVGLGGPARERLKAADPEIHARMEAMMVFNDRQNIHLNGEDVLLEYSATGGAIARLDLLELLQDGCRAVDVRMEHGQRIENLDRFAGYDLIVGADGVNSVVRQAHADEFGTHSYLLTNFMAWYGVAKPLNPNGLTFRNYDGGIFVGHYYSYTPGMSTFVAECDAQTWTDLRLAERSEPERRAYMEEIFEPELKGAPLIDNKSNFRNFQVVTNERWHHGNRVLLGDAFHAAHPTIGSGTRLAMDDAYALFEAFRDVGPDVAAALPRFVAARSDVRMRFADAARRSFLWYQGIRQVMQQKPMDFAHDFLTRTGRIDDERLKVYAPSFHRQYHNYRLAKSA